MFRDDLSAVLENSKLTDKWMDSVVMTAAKVSLTTLVVHASVLEVRWAAGDIIGLSNYHTTSGAQ